MFCDLNIRRPLNVQGAGVDFRGLLKELFKLGYKQVAITTELCDSDFMKSDSSGKFKKGKKSSEPSPTETIPRVVDLSLYNNIGLKLFNRVNILVTDPSVFHKVSLSKIIKEYDIVSYQPGSGAVLKTLSGMTDFDILSFNPMIDNPLLSFTRKLYNQFINNGIFMELPYASAILDNTNKKHLISMAHSYHLVGGSENIIFTSGATSTHLLRAPYDVVSLGPLFGLSEEQAKRAVTMNCQNTLLNARTRRRGRATIEMSQHNIVGDETIEVT